MRVGLLIAMAGTLCSVGCRVGVAGQGGSDGGADAPTPDSMADGRSAPTVTAEIGDDEISIDIGGRYLIVFVASRNWQPVSLKSRDVGDVDLSGDNAVIQLDAIQTPLLVCTTICESADTMTSPTLVVTSESPSEIMLQGAWSWSLDDVSIDGVVEHSITATGEWTTTVEAELGAELASAYTIEYADTRVSSSLPWAIGEELDDSGFVFDEERVVITIENAPDQLAMVESDAPANRYFRESLAGTSTSISRSWSTRLSPL